MNASDGENFIVNSSDSLHRMTKIGKKALNLYYMSSIDIKVPSWSCLNTDGFDHYLSFILPEIKTRFDQIEVSDTQSFNNLEKYVQDSISSVSVSPQILEKVISELGNSKLLAVRSSANIEDGNSYSFAGQLESYLFVTNQDLEDKIKKCWASGYSARMLQYLKVNSIAIETLKVAVIFQHMIASEKSGVLFTINPLGTENFNGQLVITAGFGVGEGIVKDLVETDTYIFDQKLEKVIDAKYTEKKRQLILDSEAGSGLIEGNVPSNLQNASVLTRGQIEKLVGIGKQLRRFHGQEQDMEWAIDDEGVIFITQCRPITSIGKSLGGGEFFLDNSNVVESFPGVNTPWTISQIREVYSRVFADAANRVGISMSKITSNRSIFNHLIAIYKGRIFYNLTNWYSMMRLVPYTESYIQVWEQMLGVEKNIHSHSKNVFQKLLKDPLQLIKTGFYLLLNLFTLNVRMHFLDRKLKNIFKNFWQDHDRGDFHGHRPHELVAKLQLVKDECFEKWDLTLLNDIYAFIWTGITKKLIEKWVSSDESDKVFNDLLLGENGMDSVLPIKSIINMSQLVAKNSDLEEKIKSMIELREVKPQLFKDNNEQMSFRHLFNEHLEHYSDRGANELKLETITFRENPVLLLQMILDYIPTAMSVGDGPEKDVVYSFDLIEQKLSASRVKKLIFNLSLKLAKRSINYRENFRLHRSRAYGIVRRLTLILGQRLCELKIISNQRDIFFLEQSDVANLVNSLSYEQNLIEKVKINKTQFKNNLNQKCSSKYKFSKLNFTSVLEKEFESSNAERLFGSPCSSGIIEAPALVLSSYEGIENDPSSLSGKILVAPMTDPGWVFLMTVSKGLIVEKGSILSHTAIIGRELGVPTIVGVRGATHLIKSGDLIRMNGTTGEIQILKKALDE